MTDTDRTEALASAIAELEYDGIVAFDQSEPEYRVYNSVLNDDHNPDVVFLLALCSGALNYRFPEGMNADDYWAVIENTVSNKDELQKPADAHATMKTVLEAPVCRLKTDEKRRRLDKLFDDGFAEWFVNHHADVPADQVWKSLADAIDGDLDQKTVAFAVKVYDIAHLIAEDHYLTFQETVPIPVDFHVRNVTKKAGLIPTLPDPNIASESALTPYNSDVREAWYEVVNRVNNCVVGNISVLRVDSLVWQLGRQIYYADTDPTQNLVEYMTSKIGVPEYAASQLADELVGHGSQDASERDLADSVTPVSAVNTDDEWIDELVVEVLTLWDPNHESIAQTGLIGDETGKCKFTKWETANLPELEEGVTYRFENVVTDEFNERYSVELNSRSAVSRVD